MVYEGLIMVASASVAAANAAAVGQTKSAKYNMYGQIGSALVGSVGSLFGANASAKQQYKYQSKLQEQAAKLNYDYSLKSAENMPSSTRQGLEDAGYNPMLAVQNASSVKLANIGSGKSNIVSQVHIWSKPWKYVKSE